MINLRNALMAGKRLPYDAEVEYLESTGTQWIDTGTPVWFDGKIEMTFSPTTTGNQYLFGDSITASGFLRLQQTTSNTLVFQVQGGSTVATGPSMTIGTYYTAKVDNRKCFVDGVQYGTIAAPEVSSRTYPAYVFAYNRSPMLYGKMRLASLKIYDANGVLVRDYIPVRKGTVGYLYDRVSGKLFGNAGTGAFGYGNDLKYPIPAS